MSSYIVTLAGIAGDNGTYMPIPGLTTLNGKPCWSLGGGTTFGTPVISYNSNGSGTYDLNPNWGGVGSGFSDTEDYRSPSTTDPSTAGGGVWTVINGSLPVPTVTLVGIPSAPPAPTYGTPTQTSIVVNIPALAGGATSYDLWRAPDASGSPGTFAQVTTGVTPSGIYTDTGRTANTKYWYYLLANNGSGSTIGANNSTGTLPTTETAPVTGVYNDTSVTLTIPTLSGATSWVLQHAPDSSGSPGTWATIATGLTSAQVYVDSPPLVGNTKYWWRILATNSWGTQGGSTATLTTAPAPPSGVTVIASMTGAPHVTIGFIPATGATGTNVYRATSISGVYSLLAAGTNLGGSTFTDSTVAVSTAYYYKFTSLNASAAESALGPAYGPAIPTITSGGGNMERATAYEGSQLALETTPGVTVAASKRLLCTDFMPDIMPDVRKVRAQGNKFDTDISIGKEYTTGKITGSAAYYDMLYLLASVMCTPTITTPVSNIWNVTGASGTIGMTVITPLGTVVLSAASFANAAALQTALGALSNVGAGNVTVTGTAPTYVITFIGFLSTGAVSITTATGTPTPTIAAAYTATNTRRWTFLMNPYGPETSIATYTLEKGAPGVANFGQQIGQTTVTALQMQFTAKEMSVSGDFIGQSTVDPFTMTSQGSITSVTSAPMNSKDVAIFIGTTLAGMVRQGRIMAYEWGTSSRHTPVMTLDTSQPSMSNTVESAGVEWTQKMTMAQDANGQTVLGYLRAGTLLYRVVEILGPTIETGFRMRYKITEAVKITTGPKADTDGLYTGAYESFLVFDPVTLNAAVKIEIDVAYTAL